MSRLPISKLADRSGVSARTIRYYVSEGLLPAPRTRGRYAEYGSEYIDRLRLIARLKATFLPLKEIRDRVSNLTDLEVSELLADEFVGDVAAVSSALGHESTSVDPGVSEWIRYRLEDGIELSVLNQLPPWRERMLRRILTELRTQLQDW